MAEAQFDRRFSPAEATRGSWVPLDPTTISGGIPSASRGKYAQCSYIVGSEPGALNIALSGGTVILPVSSVNISEPVSVENYPGKDLVVTQNFPDTTVYSSVSIPATAVATVNFATNVSLLEIFNNDSNLPVFVGFNNVTLGTLSAEALPVVAETYYSVERDTSNVYIGNVDPSTSIDVRVIGHRKV